MSLISKDIDLAQRFLTNGDVVAIPTETVYGLAGNIYDDRAIKKIFEIKERPLFNPLIVHTHSLEKVEELVLNVPDKARLLAEAFWPGSLTLVLKKKSHIPDLITAGKDTVGVRIPKHPLTLRLLKQLPFPLAAPSANPFMHISPTTAVHVDTYFKEALSMVLDGGACENGLESTIIGFEDEEPVLYRLGSISLEKIIEVVGPVHIKNNKELAPNAPGMLARHYAPRTKTYLTDNISGFLEDFENSKIGVLCFSKHPNVSSNIHVEILSPTANLDEAASKIYSTLHKLDRLSLDIIVAERFPDIGLGKSINDRLQRATK